MIYLTSFESVKLQLRATTTDDSLDTDEVTITQYIAEASAWIESECNRYFIPRYVNDLKVNQVIQYVNKTQYWLEDDVIEFFGSYDISCNLSDVADPDLAFTTMCNSDLVAITHGGYSKFIGEMAKRRGATVFSAKEKKFI